MTGATPSAAQAVIACLQLMDRLPGGYTLKTSTPSYEDGLVALLNTLNVPLGPAGLWPS